MTSSLFNSPAPIGPLGVTLRPYQQEAIDGLYSWFGAHDGNPLVVVPTGGGKSLIIAAFVHSVLSQWPGERVLVLTHVRELIEQNYQAMLRAWPSAPAGIYSAGLRRREHDARILFAGIQSTNDKAGKIGRFDLVVIDEAHLIPKSGFGMYRELLADLQSMNSKLKVIGLTATPFRTGEGSLDKGDDRMFHGTAYTCDISRLILEGYLSRVVPKSTANAIDTTGVHVRLGDYVESELAQAAMVGDLVKRQCDEVLSRGVGRKAMLVFCCSIKHAETVAAELHSHGVSVATVFGETPKEERDATIAAFKAGDIRCLVSVSVLTTGFDAPHTDLIMLLRPTKSPVLYVQMVGRGLRIAPGKTDCLVLDFGGNVMRHGPIDAVNIREPKKGTGEGQLARECPQCQTLVSIATTVCPVCGFEWAIAESADTGSKLDEVPDDRELIAGLASRNPIERWDVHSSYFRAHVKAGKPTTLCAEYSSGFQQRVREWVCLEHPVGSFPRRKADAWWRDRGGQMPAPGTVDEALLRIECRELRRVLGVTVDTRGEWPELRGVRLEETEAGVGEVSDAPAGAVDYSDLPF